MCTKVHGSVLFSAIKTASKRCTWLWASGEKIYRFELIDWLQRNGRSKDLWNGTLVSYTCSKDLHNGTHDGSPLANGGKAN